jgi:hypothetical protein
MTFGTMLAVARMRWAPNAHDGYKGAGLYDRLAVDLIGRLFTQTVGRQIQYARSAHSESCLILNADRTPMQGTALDGA